MTTPVEHHPIRCAAWCSQYPDCRHDWTAFEAAVTASNDASTSSDLPSSTGTKGDSR